MNTAPKAISVPTGKATRFSKTINKLIDDLKKELPKAFEHESYHQKQSEIQKKYSDQQKNIIQKLEASAKERNIHINRTKTGYQTIPIVKEKPISPEEFMALPEEIRTEIEERISTVQSEVDVTIRELNKVNQVMTSQFEKLMEEIALFVVKQRIDTIREEYKGCKDILAYLDECRRIFWKTLRILYLLQNQNYPLKVLCFRLPNPLFSAIRSMFW